MKKSQISVEDQPGPQEVLVPVDDQFVHLVEGRAVKKLSDEDLARYQEAFARQTQPLMLQLSEAQLALTRNEVILGVITFERNRRATSIATPN